MSRKITDKQEAKILVKVKGKLKRASNRADGIPSLNRVESAKSLTELAPALRELMHPDTAAPRKVARRALQLSNKYGLAGI